MRDRRQDKRPTPDRRQLQREWVEHRVVFQLVDRPEGENQPLECVTANTSNAGIGLLTKLPLLLDETLALEIYVEPAKPPINAVGRVAWTKSNEDESYLSGIEFLWIGSPLRPSSSMGSVSPMWSYL